MDSSSALTSGLEFKYFAFVGASCIPFFLFDRSGFLGVNFGFGDLTGLESNASVIEPMRNQKV